MTKLAATAMAPLPLSSTEAVTWFAASLTFKGKQPTINVVTQTYPTDGETIPKSDGGP